MVHDARTVGILLRRPFVARKLGSYVTSHAVRTLHLGAGGRTHAGWLGTDIQPRAKGILRLDATRRIPIESSTFDYVYAEHMIEHITWEQGLAMLRECRRVFRPGGKIRIATPDLAVIVGLQSQTLSAEAREYIKWITDLFISNDGAGYRAVFVINNAFRNWGHKFLYDGELLQWTLEAAGFTDIRRYRIQQSDDPNLRDVEFHAVKAGYQHMSDFETMVYEGSVGTPS